jgi:hypothetical protein
MSAVTVELPPSLLRDVEEFAQRAGVSASEFVAAAAAERLKSLRALEFLREEAAKGSLEDFRAVLSRVPNRPPLPGDEP